MMVNLREQLATELFGVSVKNTPEICALCKKVQSLETFSVIEEQEWHISHVCPICWNTIEDELEI